MNKIILENGDAIYPLIASEEKFLVKYDLKLSFDENFLNIKRKDKKIAEIARLHTLLFGSCIVSIQLAPKINFLGFKRYLLSFENPCDVVIEKAGD